MTRPTLLLVALLALAGCQAENPAAPADPFLFGPTRVPPPGTGTVTPQPGLSSNRPAAAGVVSPPAGAPNALAVTLIPAPAFGGPVQAPAAGAAVTPGGDQIKVPDAARKLDAPSALLAGNTFPSSQPGASAGVTSTAPRAALSGSGNPGSSPAVADRRSDPSSSGQDRIVQTLLPRSPASATPSQFAPTDSARPLQAPANASGNKSSTVNIDDLPAATPAGQPQTSYRPTAVQLVSGIEEIGGSPTTPSPQCPGDHAANDRPNPAVQASSRYGYDPQYGWLRGKLEFSESDRHWKLRYIPVDGATDNFGGSVILTDTPLLTGYERGDFVEVAGKLISASPDKRTYAPKYEVSQLQRLAN